jgi:transposase
VEILGRERRRRWSQAEKLEIVAAVGVNGETLARVARRYDVSRSQIYNWRHLFMKRGLLPAPVGPIFLPVDIGAPMLNAEPALEDRMVSPLIVELCLPQGRRLRFDSGIEAAALTRLIRSVEAA